MLYLLYVIFIICYIYYMLYLLYLQRFGILIPNTCLFIGLLQYLFIKKMNLKYDKI
jgi:hypothetical protein